MLSSWSNTETTDLKSACQKGDEHKLRRLLPYVYDKSQLNEAMEVAAKYNHLHLVQLLHSKLSYRERDLHSVFTVACEYNRQEIAEWLSKNGHSDVYFMRDGLHRASLNGHYNMVNWLLKKGVVDSNNALFYACKGGHKTVIDLILRHMKRYKVDYELALDGAKQNGNTDIIKFIENFIKPVERTVIPISQYY